MTEEVKPKRKVGRPSVEEQAKIDKERQEDMKKRNQNRHKQKKSSIGHKVVNKDAQLVREQRGYSNANQLNISLKKLVERLVLETQAPHISDIGDWWNIENRQVRKAQLSNVKDLLTIIKALKDVINQVEADDGPNAETLVSAENVELIDVARKKLAEVGIKDADL